MEVTFDKKTDAVLTPVVNEAITQIARISGDLAIKKKGLNVKHYMKSLFAGSGGGKSNLFIADLDKILEFLKTI